eukprot:CAMPEP_0172397114 /NCGR_PEP_ID=MMETSP1061-20121228/29114_1 /TAXON_ID=37318 /ORGANISM="Pseudo-nitzschia pungens, Strain cf. pungens" /LENGTH=77 /DNA_ID=CAMNT_0013129193 /DNA_START=148 /DNA_END=378 /DNA_ORIENTATION=-
MGQDLVVVLVRIVRQQGNLVLLVLHANMRSVRELVAAAAAASVSVFALAFAFGGLASHGGAAAHGHPTAPNQGGRPI